MKTKGIAALVTVDMPYKPMASREITWAPHCFCLPHLAAAVEDAGIQQTISFALNCSPQQITVINLK